METSCKTMKKTTEVYAERLATEHIKGHSLTVAESAALFSSYKSGYLAAIEENAMPELIEALENLIKEVKIKHVEDGKDPLWAAAMAGLKVLKKAKTIKS